MSITRYYKCILVDIILMFLAKIPLHERWGLLLDVIVVKIPEKGHLLPEVGSSGFAAAELICCHLCLLLVVWSQIVT